MVRGFFSGFFGGCWYVLVYIYIYTLVRMSGLLLSDVGGWNDGRWSSMIVPGFNVGFGEPFEGTIAFVWHEEENFTKPTGMPLS